MLLEPSCSAENATQNHAAEGPARPLNPLPEHALRRHQPAHGEGYDAQTGLPNYLSFQDSLAALLSSGAAVREVAVLWIEILSLRQVFTLYGSKGTDALVRHVAGYLRSALDSGMLAGRYNDGCFLVALPASRSGKDSARRIQAIADSFLPMYIPGSCARLEVAAGVAYYPSDAQSAEGLVRFASLAASCAAARMSAAVVPYRASMRRHVLRNHRIELEMEKGLDLGQFHNAYQPKIDLATGQVLGAEALLRWNHPHWGAIPPCLFIPIAEHSDLIHRIMDLSLRTALRDAQDWHDQGLALPLIGVNVSAVSLRQESFAPWVRGILAELPIAPTKLELELTESVLFDDEELFATRIHQLKAMGVRIAIDDFGTRYTGFNVLKDLPLDAMKIDQCFIHGLDGSAKLQAICTTIVAMARQLNLRTVAEGVERTAELEALQRIGCDAGQGFLFQAAVPAAELTAFLRGWEAQKKAFGFGAAGEGVARGSKAESRPVKNGTPSAPRGLGSSRK